MPNPDLPTYATGDPMPAADMNTLVTSLQEANEAIGDSAVYRVLVSQSGTSDPTVIELQNTTGLTFTPSRTSAGHYKLTRDGDGFFDTDKCFLLTGPVRASFTNAALFSYVNITSIDINVLDNADYNTGRDGCLNRTAIELLIYP